MSKITRGEVVGTIKELAIGLIIALIIVQFIQPTTVKETSMQPTLYENDFLFLSKQSYKFGKINRGDIIVFKSEIMDIKGKRKFLIKRVIGLPGDIISIEEGKVYLNNHEIKEEYIKDGYTPGFVDKLEIPEGKIFVMGDNRLVSLDSRSADVGFVSSERIVGKAVLRLYPLNKITTL